MSLCSPVFFPSDEIRLENNFFFKKNSDFFKLKVKMDLNGEFFGNVSIKANTFCLL